MLLTCKAFGVVPVEQSTLRVTPRALPARHAALDTVIVVGGVRVKTGQVSQGSRLSIAGDTHRWGARLGVWSRPPAQSDPLARGKPGTEVAFPTAVPRCAP